MPIRMSITDITSNASKTATQSVAPSAGEAASGTNTKMSPDNNSTIGYWTLSRALHSRHRPPWIRKLAIGISSNHWSVLLQCMQCDRPPIAFASNKKCSPS